MLWKAACSLLIRGQQFYENLCTDGIFSLEGNAFPSQKAVISGTRRGGESVFYRRTRQ
jgi:hypothetical protein